MDMKMIHFEINGDSRGSLIALEENKNIPFDIKRVYYIFNTKENIRRGLHAHKKLNQVLICLKGNCTIFLTDGNEEKTVNLNNCASGLYLGSFIWREMYDFSEDCILMVLADEIYNEEDYIRDYVQFQNYLQLEGE